MSIRGVDNIFAPMAASARADYRLHRRHTRMLRGLLHHPQAPPPPCCLRVLASRTMPNANRRHAFANLSPAERQAQLRPAETWPVLSATEDPGAGRVYTTARHNEANLNVSNIVLQQSPRLASPALFWAVFAGRLQDLDVRTLRIHFPTYSWPSYQECCQLLLEYVAGKPQADRTALLTAMCAHARPFGDEPLWNLSFPQFLDLLGWVTAIKPTLLRFPILHWLAVWAARHNGLQLAYPAFVVLPSDKNERYP